MARLKEENLDSNKMMQALDEIKDFKSIEEIVHYQLEHAEPNKKFIYKLK